MLLNNLALRPNCLLTKWPFVFVTGPRSLFYIKPDALLIKNYIEAHGYPIQQIKLPFLNPQKRQQSFSKWQLNQQNKSFHFVMAYETYCEFKLHLTGFSQSTHSTFTLIDTNHQTLQASFFHFQQRLTQKKEIPISYKLHRLICQFFKIKPIHYENTLSSKNQILSDRFLDHCIELAENDFIQ